MIYPPAINNLDYEINVKEWQSSACVTNNTINKHNLTFLEAILFVMYSITSLIILLVQVLKPGITRQGKENIRIISDNMIQV